MFLQALLDDLSVLIEAELLGGHYSSRTW